MDIYKIAENEIKALSKAQQRFITGLIEEARSCNKELVKCSDILRNIRDIDMTLRQRSAVKFLIADTYYTK